MIKFDAPHKAVHHPSDRRFRIWIRPSILIAVAVLVLVILVIAWVEAVFWGLPYLAPLPQHYMTFPNVPYGFPAWIRWTHFFTFLFVTMLIRSGLSILMDHPRLYFNNDCTPGTEWIRFTPLKVPTDRMWTAKDDARYISPLVALPGYRHTVGVARSWHFIDVYGFIVTGVVFVAMLFATNQWMRLVPTSIAIVPQAWYTFVHYATLHLPPEPDGFYSYNALQQLAYFAVVFVLAPLQILTGVSMSPAVVNHFPWYAKLFGGRQGGRSLHFLLMLAFSGFIIVHVALVVYTGFVRNMNHIVFGTDTLDHGGMIFGLVGIAVVVACWIIAHYISWIFPRALQLAQKSVSMPLRLHLINRFAPAQHYKERQISPHFWPNGKLPVREDWKMFVETEFLDYKLKIGGLVENPVELSLPQLADLGIEHTITMHHCIQGWSGIAEWNGISMKKLIELVRPLPVVKAVAFYSFGEALYGGTYYETQSLENVLKAECMLAFEMNRVPLPKEYGAPLRLRVENQLGYKMIKWIERIEFIESEKLVGQGQGGSNEDDEYFDLLPNI